MKGVTLQLASLSEGCELQEAERTLRCILARPSHINICFGMQILTSAWFLLVFGLATGTVVFRSDGTRANGSILLNSAVSSDVLVAGTDFTLDPVSAPLSTPHGLFFRNSTHFLFPPNAARLNFIQLTDTFYIKAWMYPYIYGTVFNFDNVFRVSADLNRVAGKTGAGAANPTEPPSEPITEFGDWLHLILEVSAVNESHSTAKVWVNGDFGEFTISFVNNRTSYNFISIGGGSELGFVGYLEQIEIGTGVSDRNTEYVECISCSATCLRGNCIDICLDLEVDYSCGVCGDSSCGSDCQTDPVCTSCGGCHNCYSDTCVDIETEFCNPNLLDENTCDWYSCNIPGCVYCSTNTTCFACDHQLGYLLLTDTAQCWQGELCPSGYFSELNPDSYSFCHPCVDNCSECTGSAACDECNQSFYLTSDQLCDPCRSDCATCSGPSSCDSCRVGYFLSSSQTCDACRSDCATCSDSSSCSSCIAGYYLSSAQACEECRNACVTCSDATVCSSCESGYYLSSTQSCEVCPSSDACISCETGYYVSSAQICEVCPSECVTCSNDNGCDLCESGSYLLSTQTCAVCPKGCTTCFDSNVCDNCELGYYLASTKVCERCSSNCTHCSGENTCMQCEADYYLKDGMCEECPDDCATCYTCSGFNTTETAQTAGLVLVLSGSLGAATISIVLSDYSVLWSFVHAAQVICLMPVQRVDAPKPMQILWSSFGGEVLELPNPATSSEDSEESPKEWESTNFSRISLLTSIGEVLFVMAVTVSFLPLFVVGLIIFRRCPKLYNFFKNRVQDYRWCYFMRAGLEGYLEFIAAAVINLKGFAVLRDDTSNWTWENRASLLILVCGAATLLLMIVFLVCNKNRISRNDPVLEKRYGTLFEEFKRDGSLLSLMFYPLFCIRRIQYVMALYFLSDYPGYQLFLNSLGVIVVLAHLLVYKPFKKKTTYKITVISELTILFNFALSGLHLYADSTGDHAVAIFFCCLASFVFMISTIYGFAVLKLCALMKRCCRRRPARHTTVMPLPTGVDSEQEFRPRNNSKKQLETDQAEERHQGLVEIPVFIQQWT